jgi:hypothetical protein
MNELLEVLIEITEIAERVDSWESFPSAPIERARTAIDKWQARAEQAAPAWIPVSERLPDPGVPVLVFVPHAYGDSSGSRRLRAQYAAEKTLEQSDDSIESGIYDSATDTYWCEPGWYETNEYEGVHWRIQGDVTHWMPLPAAPQEQK